MNGDANSKAVGGGSGFTCLRCDVHGTGDGFIVWGSSPVTIQDSYVHGLYIRDDLGSHNQDVITNGFAAGLTIRHNRLENWDGQTATISLFGDFSPVQNVLIDGNLLDGGGYAVYGGSTPGKPYSAQARNIVVTGNQFGRTFHPRCGRWGAVTDFAFGAQGNRWAANVWADTRAAVT
jgi:hypothetical protein